MVSRYSGRNEEETKCAGNNGAKFASDINTTLHSLYSAGMTGLVEKTLSEA